jgi:hypothetical protein
MIVFAFFSIDAHGASLLVGLLRLSSPNVRVTFMSQATDKLKRLLYILRQLRTCHHAINASGTI